MGLIRIRRYEVKVPGLQGAGPLRLAFLTDLHNNIYPGLLRMLEEAAPDAVLIGGDMVNRPTVFGEPPRFTRGYGCVKKLAARFPVYYVPGNHESRWKAAEKASPAYAAYRRALEKKGVRFLENESVLLRDGPVPVRLYGLEMTREQYRHAPGRRRPPEAGYLREKLGEAPKEGFTILLPHHPDYLERYAAWGADLVLAGHLHGGQMRLPGLGGVIAPGFTLFPPYTRGRFEKDKTTMIVSAGLGTHTIPLRLFDPREALIIDLV